MPKFVIPNQNQKTDIQENLSSELTTSKPQSPSRLGGMEKRVGSSMRACSARMETIRSDQSEFDTQEKLSSDVTTTSMPQTLSSIAKQLRSSSKMRFLHKRKRQALEKNKKNLVTIKPKA